VDTFTPVVTAAAADYNLTASGYADWAVVGDKKLGGAYIDSPLTQSTNPWGGLSGGGPFFTWTDGTNALTGSGNGAQITSAGYYASAVKNVKIDAAGVTITMFVTNIGSGDPFDIWLNGAEVTVVGGVATNTRTLFQPYSGTDGKVVFTLHSDNPLGEIASFGLNSGNQESDGGIYAMGVSAAPEPATMCLLVIGGIGALLRRRRKV
jgi:hypothetical protein